MSNFSGPPRSEMVKLTEMISQNVKNNKLNFRKGQGRVYKNMSFGQNMVNNRNTVSTRTGFKLGIKYEPMYIQVHDPNKHVYVMYFRLIPQVQKIKNHQTKRLQL